MTERRWAHLPKRARVTVRAAAVRRERHGVVRREAGAREEAERVVDGAACGLDGDLVDREHIEIEILHDGRRPLLRDRREGDLCHVARHGVVSGERGTG